MVEAGGSCASPGDGPVPPGRSELLEVGAAKPTARCVWDQGLVLSGPRHRLRGQRKLDLESGSSTSCPTRYRLSRPLPPFRPSCWPMLYGAFQPLLAFHPKPSVLPPCQLANMSTQKRQNSGTYVSWNSSSSPTCSSPHMAYPAP